MVRTLEYWTDLLGKVFFASAVVFIVVCMVVATKHNIVVHMFGTVGAQDSINAPTSSQLAVATVATTPPVDVGGCGCPVCCKATS